MLYVIHHYLVDILLCVPVDVHPSRTLTVLRYEFSAVWRLVLNHLLRSKYMIIKTGNNINCSALRILAKRYNDYRSTRRIYVNISICCEIPAVRTVMVSSVCYIYQFMILRIEGRISKVIRINSAYLSLLNRRHFGLNSCVTCDRISYLRFFTTRIEPSAESIALTDLRQCTYFRQHTQSSAFIGLLTSNLLAILILENDLTRHDIRRFSKEIRNIRVTCQLKRQRSRITGIHIRRVLCIVSGRLTTSCIIAERSKIHTVFLDIDRRIAILASSNGEFHRTIHRHRDYTALYSVLTTIIGRALYRHTCRQFTARRQQYGIRIVAELNFKVHKRTCHILHKLNLLQRCLRVHTTTEVDIVLLRCQFNHLRAILSLLARRSILRLTLNRLFITAHRPVPYLDIGSIATTTRTKTQLQLTGYSCLRKTAITRTVQLDALQAVIRTCRVIDLIVKIQRAVLCSRRIRTAGRSSVCVIPQQVIRTCQHCGCKQAAQEKIKNTFHVYKILIIYNYCLRVYTISKSGAKLQKRFDIRKFICIFLQNYPILNPF